MANFVGQGLLCILCVTYLMQYVVATPAHKLVTLDDSFCAYDGMRVTSCFRAGNETQRDLIRLSGWRTVERNHPCGHAARLKLSQLLKRFTPFVATVQLTGDNDASEGEEVALISPELEIIASAMIQSGLAGYDFPRSAVRSSLLSERKLAQLDASVREEVRANLRTRADGCYVHVSSFDDSDEWTTIKEEYSVSASEGLKRTRIRNTSSRLSFSVIDNLPTGFMVEEVSRSYIYRPVDFLFLPTGHTIIAQNDGRVVRLDEDGRSVSTLFMDLRAIANDYHDHGLMSIAIRQDYEVNPYVYFFIVYDHSLAPEDYQLPRTSRAMRVEIGSGGTQELVDSRETIVGSESGFGCGGAELTDPEADCIAVDNKSHVGGGLGFDFEGNLYIATGDGTIAWIVDEVLRSQQLSTLNGKVLKVSTEDSTLGYGLDSNPYYDGDPTHRQSKVFATGARNPLHVHPSLYSNDRFYMADTQWESMEEVSIGRKGSNFGWPCFEGTLPTGYWDDSDECAGFGTSKVHTEPAAYWYHVNGGNSAAITGERVQIASFPPRYRDVLTYSDQARKILGFMRLDENDNVVEHLNEWWNVGASAVQVRAGPDSAALYYNDVRRQGKLFRVTYEANLSPVQIAELDPAADSAVSSEDLKVVGTFSKSMEPDTVNENSVYLTASASGVLVASTVVFDFGSRSFEIIPDEDLPLGQTFVVHIKGGGEGVLDLDRNVLPSDLTFAFSTLGEADDVPPVVIKVIPDDGSEGEFDPSARVKVRFNEGMDPLSISASSVKVEPAILVDEILVPFEDSLELSFVSYFASTREIRFEAPLAYSGLYLVTVVGGTPGINTDVSGNPLSADHTFSFKTMENPANIAAEILVPELGTEAAVGERVYFRGSAHLIDSGGIIDDGAFNWQVNILHCTYDVPLQCHSHAAFEVVGVSSGSFIAPTHDGRFYYEIYLLVSHSGESLELTRAVETRKVSYTLDSAPQGVDVVLSGHRMTTPATLAVVIGSEVQLFAPEYVQIGNSGYSFQRWTNGGSRVQNFVASNSDETLVAIFEADVEETGVDRVEIMSKSAIIPLSGSIDVGVEYEATQDRDIVMRLYDNFAKVVLETRRFAVHAAATRGTFSFVGRADRFEGREYQLRVDLRLADGAYSSRLDKDLFYARGAVAAVVAFEDPPEFIAESGPIFTTAQYFGGETGAQIAFKLVHQLTGGLIAEARADLSEAEGAVVVGPLDYDGLEPAGELFELVLELWSGGSGSNAVLASTIEEVTVGTFESVRVLSTSSTLPTEGPLNVLVWWSATTSRDVRVILRNLSTKQYVDSVRKVVEAGQGAHVFTFDYSGLRTDFSYQVRADLRPNGAKAVDRVDRDEIDLITA
ncbi:hypothetical protein NDN08_005939 [Rhodosorus marinus]|uniref:Glucose/Sorbosone dehydrogenase domain-containing protein n=1 Tax=Rhodosorus marinus TaxID=101924 RepID=A0AAV8UKV5_9RHOD|nr:hypothetical protein NDN08_005939 [Rhodosorus marinus]